MPILGIIASAISGNLFAPSGAYDSIATVTSPAATSVTFSSISQGYTHLQIRGIANNGETSGYNNQALQFNGDTSTSYRVHRLAGDGSSAVAGSSSSTTQINDIFRIPATSSGYFGAFVIDVLDYTSTNKNKTVRVLNGGDSNGSGWIGLHSGLWYATPAAITSITIISSVGNFGTDSSFALYGIKGS